MLEIQKILTEIRDLLSKKDSWKENMDDFGITEKIGSLLKKGYDTYHKEFEKYISPIIELPEDDSICAIISRESYKTANKRKKEINGFIFENNISTRDIAVYTNNARKICILGYRGTDVRKVKDLSSDAQILLDIQGLDPRVKTALHNYDICRRQYDSFSFRLCGHSLWGTIAYIVAKHREPNKCVVFNPGVSLNTFFLQMIEDTIKGESWTKRTKTYKILGDIISTAAFVWDTKIFSIKSSDPLKKHTINNFLPQKKIEDILRDVTLPKLIEE